MEQSKRRFPRTLFLLSLVALLIVVGCGGRPKIVGKWQISDDQSWSIEFLPGGTCNVYTGESLEVSGTYTVVDSTHLKMEEEGDSCTMALTWSGNNSVTLRDENGPEPIILKRVK